MKEKSRKWDAVRANDTSSGKMILTLLTEVVTFYVGLTIVEIGKYSF